MSAQAVNKGNIVITIWLVMIKDQDTIELYHGLSWCSICTSEGVYVVLRANYYMYLGCCMWFM